MALTKIKPSGLETTGNYLLSQLTTSGNLIGNGNVNFNNSGNVSLGAIGNIHISGGTSGYVLQTDGSGTLSWAAQSGGNPGGSNTYIQFNDAGGFGGTAGLTFDKTSNTITANGNITTTNANLGNAVTANYFIGNGSLLTGLPASYSNTNVAAYLPTYTGNFTAGNISVSGTITGTVSSATTAGTVTTAAQPNITSVGSLSSLTVTGLLTATASGVKTSNIIDSAGTNTISVTSANVGIIGNLLVGTGGTGNVTATYFIGNGATLTNIAGGNVTGTVSNSTTAGTVIANAQPNITSVGTLSSLTVTGNATAGNGSLGNLVTANFFSGSGNLLSNIQGGNVTGTVSNATTAGTVITAAQPNITSVGTLASLTVTANITGGNANLGNLVTANYVTGTLTTAAQPNITSVGTLTNLSVTGNLTTGNLITGGSAGNISGANYISANYLTGTLTTAAQPNITSVGTLTSLAVTANANVGNINATNAVLSGNATITGNLIVNGATEYTNVTNLYVKDPIIEMGGAANGGALSSNDGKDRGTLLHYYTTAPVDAFMGWDTSNSEFAFGSNVTLTNEVVTFNTFGNVRAGNFIGTLSGAATTAGTVTTAAQPNITSTGTLTSLTVTGNVTSGNANLGNAVTANYFIGNFYGTANSATTSGTVTTAAQPNITSTGTLVSLSITGNVTAGNASLGNLVTANFFSGSGNLLSNIQAGNITGTVSNATTAGTVITAAQPNITSVGTLTSLAVTANANVGNLNVTANVQANGLQLTGSSGDEGGEMLLAKPQTNSTIAGTGVTIDIYQNKLRFFEQGGSARGAYIDITAASAGVGSDLLAGGSGGYANSNVAAYLPTYTGNLTAGNITGPNLISGNYFTGTLTTAAQPNITSVGTLTSLTITGLLTATANGVKTSNIIDSAGTNTISISSSNVGIIGNLLVGSGGTGWVSASNFSGSGNTLTNLNASNIASGTIPSSILGNSTLYVGTTSIALNRSSGSQSLTGVSIDGSAASATTADTVTTAAQPNITSVGTLNGLTANGTVNFINSSNVSLGAVGNVKITGGTTGQYLQTDGSGTLSWATVSSGSTSNIANGTSNVNIPASDGNVNTSVGGNANILVVTSTGANVTGYLTVTGALSAGGGTGGSISGANVISANYFTGTLTTAAQPNITSLGTLTGLTSGGVINFISASNVSLGAVGNVKITGGTSGQVLSTDGAGTLSWATASGGGGATLSAVAGSTTYYIGLSANTSGTWTDARVDSTNLYYSSGTQTLYATNYNTSSDETLKTNIHTIENALVIISALRGVGFDWLDTGIKSYGVIAQELEKIIPDIVNTDNNGRKTVNYNALIGFLIEAIKTQSTQIQTLEKRITRLEEK